MADEGRGWGGERKGDDGDGGGGRKESGGAVVVRLGEQGNGQWPRLGETFGCEPSRTELR